MIFRLFGNVVMFNVVGWFMFLNKIYNSHINISVVSTGLQLKCQSPGGCQDQLLILLLANSKFNYFHQVFSQCRDVSWLLININLGSDPQLFLLFTGCHPTPSPDILILIPPLHPPFLPSSLRNQHYWFCSRLRLISNSVSLISLTKSNRAERMIGSRGGSLF